MPTAFDADEIAAGTALFAQRWTFQKGVVAMEHLPHSDRPEIAFAGRSNVGKSSLINALTLHGGLARTSNTPGRTQELNFFTCQNHAFYLVDMPGYGFAEAPKQKVDAWTGLIKDYLRGRQALARVMLLIDSRHGIKKVDLGIMELMSEAAVSFQVVLTKSDKINAYELKALIERTEAALKQHAAAMPEVLATSSEKSLGLDEVRATVAKLVGDLAGR